MHTYAKTGARSPVVVSSLRMACVYAIARGVDRQSIHAAGGLLAAAIIAGLVAQGPQGRADADRLIEPLVMITPILAAVLIAGATRRGRLGIEIGPKRRLWPLAAVGLVLECTLVALLGLISLALGGYGLAYSIHVTILVVEVVLLAAILSRAISSPWWWAPILVGAFGLLTPGLIPLRYNPLLSLDAASPSILLAVGAVIAVACLLMLPRLRGSDV